MCPRPRVHQPPKPSPQPNRPNPKTMMPCCALTVSTPSPGEVDPVVYPSHDLLVSLPVARWVSCSLHQARSDLPHQVPSPGSTPWSPLSLLPTEPSHYRAVFVLNHWTPKGYGRKLSARKPVVVSSRRIQSNPSLSAPTRVQSLASLPVTIRVQALVLGPAPTRLQVPVSVPVQARPSRIR